MNIKCSIKDMKGVKAEINENLYNEIVFPILYKCTVICEILVRQT